MYRVNKRQDYTGSKQAQKYLEQLEHHYEPKSDVYELKAGDHVDEMLEVARMQKIPVMIEFYSPTCPPCVNFAETYEKHATENKDKIACIRADVGKCRNASKQYKIDATPTFISFKNGKQVERVEGASEQKLKLLLKDLK